MLKILKTLGILLLLGLIQRLCLYAICFKFSFHFSDIIVSLLTGLIFDISFLSCLFILFFLLRTLIKEKASAFLYILALVIWVMLNAFDIFSIRYTSTRASLNSFNLFKISDIATKLSDLKLIVFFAAFTLAFLYLAIKNRKKITPQLPLLLKEKIIVFVGLFSASLMYLPYPLNYYSDQLKISKEAKQLAINPYFFWATSFMYSSEKYIMDTDLALKNFKQQLNYPIAKNNFLVRDVNYSDSAYNSIILIVMESFGANRIGALNGEKNLSPYFDTLCKEGTLYTKCFSCGPRTQYAISSILFGFPHILQYNLFRENKLKLPFNGLANLLAKNKYKMHFLHAGKADYDDMRLLINAENNTEIRDKTNINSFKFKNEWGIDDESFFDFSERYIAETKGNNLFCLLSMSNHEPFQLPEDFKLNTNYNDLSPAEKTFLYSDQALGKFIEKLKTNGQFQRSLIIVTGDHGELYSPNDGDSKLFHVPLLVLDHKNKNIKNTATCSHADIAEYILSKTKYKDKSHLIGQGLVAKEKKQTYYRNYNNSIYQVTDSVIYKYDIINKTLSKLLYNQNMYVSNEQKLPLLNKSNQQIAQGIKAYYTATQFIFQNGVYYAN